MIDEEKEKKYDSGKQVPLKRFVIQRFDPVRYSDQGGWDWCSENIKQCVDGEYIKYDDNKKDLSTIKQWVEMGLPKPAAMITEILNGSMTV